MLKVKSGGLADNFGLCDGDQVLQVGRMKVDPRDGLNLGNVEMLLRMPTPQLEIVVFRLVDCLLNLNKIILSLQIVSAVSFLIFFLSSGDQGLYIVNNTFCSTNRNISLKAQALKCIYFCIGI